MNWGRGLALALIAFAGLMTWFVVKAVQNPEPLVTEQYYEQELKYQERIDATTRAGDLSSRVTFMVVGDAMLLRFPAEAHARHVTGTMHLLRPNEPLDDRWFEVASDTSGAFISAPLALKSGRYNAELEWRMGNEDYYTAEKITVP